MDGREDGGREGMEMRRKEEHKVRKKIGSVEGRGTPNGEEGKERDKKEKEDGRRERDKKRERERE